MITSERLLKMNLYKYQQEAIDFLNEFPQRGICGDDMGLGKTRTALMLAEQNNYKSVLIVCPKTVQLSWRNEIRKVFNNDDFTISPDKASLRKKEFEENKRFFICNYAILRVEDFGIFSRKWDLVIFDEAHRLKNRKAQISKKAKLLKAKKVLLLSGTPMQNHPSEIWHLLHLLDRKNFKSYWKFIEKHFNTQVNYFSGFNEPTTIKNIEEFQKEIFKYMIKRSKEDVKIQLPKKIYSTIPVKLEQKHQKIYKDLIKNLQLFNDNNEEVLRIENQITLYTNLRRLVLFPEFYGINIISEKIKALLEILEDSNEKFVIFTWHKSFSKYLHKLLNSNKIESELICGDNSSEERIISQEKFSTNEKTKCLVLTIATGCEGLNLQSANNLIFMEKAWNPAMNEQAENRIHRIGQEKVCTIYDIVAEETIEEKIIQTLSKKTIIISEALFIKEIMNDLIEGRNL